MKDKKTEDNTYPSIEESKEVLRESTPADFDGHTKFKDLSPAERIRWASLSARAVYTARIIREKDGMDKDDDLKRS